MVTPIISIIIPTKNESSNIARCLQSIKSQTFPQNKIEIIVVDDHSIDQTSTQAKHFTSKVYTGRKYERSSQRNFGAYRARGKYLLFLDADMQLSPTVVAQVVDCLATQFTIVSIPEIGQGHTFWERVMALERSCYYLEKSMHAARGFTRKSFLQLGGYDENMYAGEDWDLTLRYYTKNYALSPITSHLYHHEHIPSLPSYLRKERYYISNIHYFAAKHPQEFAKLASFRYRGWLFLKNWSQFVRHPFLSASLVGYKLFIHLWSRPHWKKTEPALQSPQTKLAEISWRKQLTRQQLFDAPLFPSEPNQTEMFTLLHNRITKRRHDFNSLRDLGVLTSPFLEIGSGYGETALLLINEFKLRGTATDLAPHPLKFIKTTAHKLHYSTLPTVKICDAEKLPFPANSFSFIFSYQTLHHFPHPQPVLDEVYRVLKPGGYYFFGEEPIAQAFNLALWRRPTKLRPFEKVLKYTGLLHFVSCIGKSETDQGILEETFSLDTWQSSLSRFTIINSHLSPFPFGPTTTLSHPSVLCILIILACGGGISALLQKPPRHA